MPGWKISIAFYPKANERCFQGFIRPDLLKKHMETCKHFPIQATTTVDKEIRFKNWDGLRRKKHFSECMLIVSAFWKKKIVKI